MQHAASDPAARAVDDVAAPPDLLRAIGDDGSVDAAFREGLEHAAQAYRHVLRLRLVSARMIELHRAEKVAYHASCIGEEAPIVAAALAARPEDWVFPGAREWGAALVRGVPLSSYLHHAFGTSRDPAKGHAAPDHLPSRAQRVAPPSGVVGAQLPQAVGCAWAARSRKDELVAFALFGEGATSTGDFHNALNFAGVFKAPCVFVCRNNGRATSLPASRQTRSRTFAEKAVAYGVACARVDGTDAVATGAVVAAAASRAREGKGATLIEVVTEPPLFADGAWPPGDLLAIGERDPLARLRRLLEREGRLEAGETDRLAAEVRAELDAAIAEAERAGAPDPRSIFEDVFAEVPPHLAGQREALSWRR